VQKKKIKKMSPTKELTEEEWEKYVGDVFRKAGITIAHGPVHKDCAKRYALTVSVDDVHHIDAQLFVDLPKVVYTPRVEWARRQNCTRKWITYGFTVEKTSAQKPVSML
jgi:hypothetical protein